MRTMKDSGIEWIGEIPENWRIESIGRHFENRNEKVSDYDYAPLSVTKSGVVPQLDEVAKSNAHEDRKLVRRGDFVINSRSDRKQSCGLSSYDGSVSLINLVLVPHGEIDSLYSSYLFNNYGFAEEFYRWGTGIVADLWSTKWNMMRRINVPVPPIAEQKKIADFLDGKCAEIDELVQTEEKMIEELKAYKQSVITEAVTKGLDPAAPMKDSGIEWTGKIPASWEVGRMKYVADINAPCKDVKQYERISYAPMECIKRGWMECQEISPLESSSGLTTFEENDIVMAKVTPCFENGNIAVAKDLINGVALGSSELFVFRARTVLTEWLFYFLQNSKFTDLAKSTMVGTGGLKRVSPKFVSNYQMGVPPLCEQKQIADYLDEKCAKIDEIIALRTEQINQLKEYKKSLIYEYVTGKKEVV